jgi:hypothetical protein
VDWLDGLKLLAPPVLTATLGLILKRKVDGIYLARLALVDILTTLRATEAAFKHALHERADLDYANFTEIASEYVVQPPSLGFGKLLEISEDYRYSRAVMLFFDHQRHFELFSSERKDAYYWLLDARADASDAARKERLEILRGSKARILEQVKGLLRQGYDIADFLAAKLGNVPVGRSVSSVLADYGLTTNGVRWRRRYYAAADFPAPYSGSYRAYKWDGGTDPARLRIEIAQPHGKVVFVLSPLVEVALPELTPLDSLTAHLSREDWPAAKPVSLEIADGGDGDETPHLIHVAIR